MDDLQAQIDAMEDGPEKDAKMAELAAKEAEAKEVAAACAMHVMTHSAMAI